MSCVAGKSTFPKGEAGANPAQSRYGIFLDEISPNALS